MTKGKEMECLDKWTRRSAITHGISDERLMEICEAERAGRCVVLPCKPSDVTVYEVRDKKHAWGIGVSPRHVSCTMVWADGDYRLCHQGTSDLNQLNFGKQWFLREEQAREEAERRKSGGQNGEEKF
jgi:hypothetical protein